MAYAGIMIHQIMMRLWAAIGSAGAPVSCPSRRPAERRGSASQPYLEFSGKLKHFDNTSIAETTTAIYTYDDEDLDIPRGDTPHVWRDFECLPLGWGRPVKAPGSGTTVLWIMVHALE